jgi:hypothetical protein
MGLTEDSDPVISLPIWVKGCCHPHWAHRTGSLILSHPDMRQRFALTSKKGNLCKLLVIPLEIAHENEILFGYLDMSVPM